jgi:hypothetical protein
VENAEKLKIRILKQMINIQIHSDIIKMQTYKEEKENHSN